MGGRLTREDVENIWRKASLKHPLLNLQHNPLWARAAKRVPMTRLRKRVAERLLEAKIPPPC